MSTVYSTWIKKKKHPPANSVAVDIQWMHSLFDLRLVFEPLACCLTVLSLPSPLHFLALVSVRPSISLSLSPSFSPTEQVWAAGWAGCRSVSSPSLGVWRTCRLERSGLDGLSWWAARQDTISVGDKDERRLIWSLGLPNKTPGFISHVSYTI